MLVYGLDSTAAEQLLRRHSRDRGLPTAVLADQFLHTVAALGGCRRPGARPLRPSAAHRTSAPARRHRLSRRPGAGPGATRRLDAAFLRPAHQLSHDPGVHRPRSAPRVSACRVT
ncbi:hypothetical protein [Nocardia farcinica]|uniref:hypothetical protein n=1 Tax=Nocardia farcinica TaxID=37329 RepID=UPI00398361FE